MATINTVGLPLSGNTGTGSFVGSTSPTLVTPTLGTVASGVISACTSSGIVLTAPVLGTPASGALTNCTSIPVANATGILPIANGGTGVASTKVRIQSVSTITGAVATGTTVVPADDTIPQNTEGDQYMSLAITPTNSSNILEITAQGFFQNSSAGAGQFIVSLFQDSTANALTTATGTYAAGFRNPVYILYRVAAGTTSATTFKIRCGSNLAGTTTFNGGSGNRFFGGAYDSFITITEYQV